ncbi:MAG TPA: hypothetical protein VET48_05260, partial [Steroidobacteraceae bacterium]|nr:hypothetical protein [Steroidobacteraceae bacterium]
YLKTFFGDPHIERVSDAEQKRFIDPPPKKSTGDADTAKPQARVIALEEAREPKFEHASTIVIPAPAATRSPEIGAHSTGATGSHSVGKSATPATKRSASTTARKTSGTKVNGKPLTSKYAHLSVEERTAIKEARMLGLSETAIRRIAPNSLLSRLVGKLTK